MPRLQIPEWDHAYPPPAELRADAQAMAEAVGAALLETLPTGAVRGIYFKGSAAKEWSSPLDYVPHLSDIDLHVWFHDEGLNAGRVDLEDLAKSLRRHEIVHDRFGRARPAPAHVPRAQVVIMNDLMADRAYASSPVTSVRVLHGEDCPTHEASPDTIRGAAVDELLTSADERVLAKLIGDLVERPGLHVFLLLRQLSWRVSPIASRLLTLHGFGYGAAWGAGRTRLLHDLDDHDAEVAELLVGYYGRAWDAYRSGWADPVAGRDTFSAGVRVLRVSRQRADAHRAALTAASGGGG